MCSQVPVPQGFESLVLFEGPLNSFPVGKFALLVRARPVLNMTSELFFRVAFSILWIIFFINVVWVRHSSRAYSINQAVERTSCREGLPPLAAVVLVSFAAFWFGGIVIYAILQGWIAFLSIPVADWFRLIMVLAGLLSIVFAVWVYRALGKNWIHPLESELREKGEGVLVTTGPYRYVRNPIYLGAFSLIVAQALVAANWLVLLPALPIIMVIYMQISGEEATLTERFGDEYREYMKRTPRIVPRLMQKHPRGRDDRQVNVDVFRNPSKYLRRLPIGEVVADARIYRKGVERYKEKIAKGESVPPIIVVKHPTKEVYAVLDGHHRYYAYVELGWKEIECALAGNVSAVILHMTEHGVFQPPSGLTEHIRVPAFEFNAKVKQFLSDFSKDPYKIQKSSG